MGLIPPSVLLHRCGTSMSSALPILANSNIAYLQKVVIACRRCGDDVSPSQLGILDGKMPNAPTPSMDEHTLTWFQSIRVESLHQTRGIDWCALMAKVAEGLSIIQKQFQSKHASTLESTSQMLKQISAQGRIPKYTLSAPFI